MFAEKRVVIVVAVVLVICGLLLSSNVSFLIEAKPFRTIQRLIHSNG